MKRIILFLTLFFVFASGCGGGKAGSTTATDTLSGKTDTTVAVNDGHNASNSLDWAGTYKGVIPCADCQGIEETVTLKQDFTYTLRSTYLGKAVKPLLDSGTFSWNQEGNAVSLKNGTGGTMMYLVQENKIIQLDTDGKPITGNLANDFILTKQVSAARAVSNATPTPDANLVETYWKLTELMGKPVPPPAENTRESRIILKKQDNRIQAFAGCNQIMGSYTLKEGNRIRFENVGSTLMACPDMKLENEFKKVLSTVDNYAIKGDTLSLNKARMAPLAKFHAVYLR